MICPRAAVTAEKKARPRERDNTDPLPEVVVADVDIDVGNPKVGVIEIGVPGDVFPCELPLDVVLSPLSAPVIVAALLVFIHISISFRSIATILLLRPGLTVVRPVARGQFWNSHRFDNSAVVPIHDTLPSNSQTEAKDIIGGLHSQLVRSISLVKELLQAEVSWIQLLQLSMIEGQTS